MTLSDIIDEYLDHRRLWKASNTCANDAKALRKLLAWIGNVQPRSITGGHMDRYFLFRSGTLSANSLNTEAAIMRTFLEWARKRGYLARDQDPMSGVVAHKVPPVKRLLIPASRFPALLDGATHPRDRISVALGMYLFVRASEIVTLRVGDVCLDRGTIDVVVHKTSQRDEMPICSELDHELRRWLTWYTSVIPGGLLGGHLLVPAKTSPRLTRTIDGPKVSDWGTPIPDRRMGHPHAPVQRALSACGYSEKGEGGHTLRRSGARALYDRLAEEGHDRALRRVQAMLHHTTLSMTERYIGIDVDRRERNMILSGKPMFDTGGSVTSLSERKLING